MWTFGFFLSLLRNTGPVDGSFAQSYATVFFHLCKTCYDSESPIFLTLKFYCWAWARLLLFLFCAETSAVHLRKKTQAFPIHAVFTCQICAITFAFDMRCLLQATHIGRGEKKKKKKWVHNRKIEEAKQVLMAKGLKAEEQGWARRRRAASCHPSCRGASGSFVRGLCVCVLKLRYGSCRPSTSL